MNGNGWLAALLLVSAAVANPAGAQDRARQAGDSARTPTAAECDTAVAHARVDSVSSTVRAYLLRTDGGVMSRNFADLLLQDFAQRFHPPQPLRIPVLAAGPASLRALAPERRTEPAARELYLQAVVDFTANPDGSASDIRLRLTSMSLAFDSTVVTTLDQMSRDHLMPLSGGGAADSIPLRLRIASVPGYPGRERPLFTSMLPRLAGFDAAEAPTNPRPEYPEEEKALGMDGYVLLRIVVGRAGRVEPGTIEVLQSTSPAFLRNALGVLDSLRFTPARVGTLACPMAQVMPLPFRFQARPPAAPR